MNRRQLVQLSGAALAVALAGCTGDDETNGDPVDTNQEVSEDVSNENGAEDASDNGDAETESDNDSQDEMDDGDIQVETDAEQTVLEYLEALDAGDLEAAERRLHPDSNILDTLDESDFEPGVTIFEIDQIPFAQVVNERFDVEDEAEVDRMQDNISDLVDQIGATDFVHVYMDLYSEQFGEEESYSLVVQHNGEWLVLGEQGQTRYEGVP